MSGCAQNAGIPKPVSASEHNIANLPENEVRSFIVVIRQ
jgi:hypothetical protein